MIGGTFLFIATGGVPLWVLAFSVPYALLPTSVLFGKHIDKIEPDTALGIRTLPVHPRRAVGLGGSTRY